MYRESALRRFITFLAFVALVVLPVRADIASAEFASDANNLTSGTVNVQRLPVGTSAGTIASGNDNRFNSIAYGRPTDSVDNTRVLVWVE